MRTRQLGQLVESELTRLSLFSLLADPYATWKIRYHLVVVEYTFACSLEALGASVPRIDQLVAALRVCEHYRRENNLHVMRRRLLPERCEA